MKKGKKILKEIPLYQIYRVKSKQYPWTAPIVSENDAVALSAFKELAKSQPELSCSYLYRVGSMDAMTGKIKLLRSMRLVTDKEKSDEK